MQEFNYTITDEAGIHMRPAGKLVARMKDFSSEITLRCGERSCDLKKLFALMSLAIKKGETITITAQGEDEVEAASAAKAFLEDSL